MLSSHRSEDVDVGVLWPAAGTRRHIAHVGRSWLVQAAGPNTSTQTFDWEGESTHLPLCQLVRGQDDVLLNKRLYQAPALPAIVS